MISSTCDYCGYGYDPSVGCWCRRGEPLCGFYTVIPLKEPSNFWSNPWMEVRVTRLDRHGKDSEGKSIIIEGIPRYYVTHVRPDSLVHFKEWEKGATPDYYSTEDKVLAEKTLSLFGLPMPVWEKDNNKHCYRAYWTRREAESKEYRFAPCIPLQGE